MGHTPCTSTPSFLVELPCGGSISHSSGWILGWSSRLRQRHTFLSHWILAKRWGLQYTTPLQKCMHMYTASLTCTVPRMPLMDDAGRGIRQGGSALARLRPVHWEHGVGLIRVYSAGSIRMCAARPGRPCHTRFSHMGRLVRLWSRPREDIVLSTRNTQNNWLLPLCRRTDAPLHVRPPDMRRLHVVSRCCWCCANLIL